MVPRFLACSMLNKCVSPRRDAPFQQVCCFIAGKHHFSTQAFRLGHIHVFKFMRCFAMAKQHFQHAHLNQKGSMGNQKPYIKPRKPRFQNQCVAKTKETTKTKQTKRRFQNQWVAKTIEKTTKTRKPRFQNQWVTKPQRKQTKTNKHNFRINDSGSRSLVLKSCFFCFVFVCFLYGFRYPLVLKSWFSCFCGFLDGFGYPLVLKSSFSCLFWFSLWFLLSHILFQPSAFCASHADV